MHTVKTHKCSERYFSRQHFHSTAPKISFFFLLLPHELSMLVMYFVPEHTWHNRSFPINGRNAEFYKDFSSQVWQRYRLIRCRQGKNRTQSWNRQSLSAPEHPQNHFSVLQCQFLALKEFVGKRKRDRMEKLGKKKEKKTLLAAFNRNNASKICFPSQKSQLAWQVLCIF